ncbi:MAG: DUF3426 domain-containing protein [Betaproteobacteria bacterium]|nr:DUF3426 domain-containing protein [Betaproteobacteria bacterium]
MLEGLADSAWLHAEEVDEEIDAGAGTGALSATPPVAGDSPASALTVPEAEHAPAAGEPAQQELPDTVLTDGGETGAHEHDAEALAEALPGHAADGRVEPALDPDFEPGFVRQARRRERWSRPWVRAVLGLLLALLVLAGAAQAAWIWRDSLAQRWPALRPALAALCAAAGCRLQPPRRPQDLALDASSMSPDGASGLRLDLRLHNRGAYAVAYPWLQLSLSSGSEADAPLVRKVIAPEQYLRAQGLGPRELRSRLDAGIGAAQDLNIRLGLALREGRAASYTVYLFYP